MKRACLFHRGSLVLAAALVLLAPPLTAQDNPFAPAPPPAASGPVPRMPDGHPDLSGVWWLGRDIPVAPLRVGNPRAEGNAPAPRRRETFADLYQRWALEKAKTLGDKDDPSLGCIPVAFGTSNNSITGLGFVGQIVQNAKFVTILTETYHSFRIIPTDGRPHRDDVAPSYRGDSVGRWEGDTLVVDTTNFTDRNWMHAEGMVSFHSDALHIVERFHRAAANILEVEATIEDPKVLTRPWQVPKVTLQIAPFDQIMEVMCTNLQTKELMEAAAKDNYGRK
ncbi:MAG: hypothetical protein HY655_10200 [Acidobacteria bacterium]|nr:hypothetical protein [Acidobacteriota bacterium]